RPEGHFWIAANMGALAESFGLRAGLKYRKPVKEELETVLRLDPAFQQGSADRALGRWYFKVPRLFGGSHKLAEDHLRASLKYNANSTASRYFLSELHPLVDVLERAEAALVCPNGVEQIRHEEAVDDEAGTVGRRDRLLAERPRKGHQRLIRRIGRRERANHFDELHDRNGVEEVQ